MTTIDSTKRVEYKDYLKEFRINQQSLSIDSDTPFTNLISNSLDFTNKNFTPYEKNQLISEKIKVLDQKFQMKEQANRFINKNVV